MVEPALQDRLETIERRQTIVIALLAGLYVAGALWLGVREIDAVTPWTATAVVVGLAIVGGIVGVYRRRRAMS